MKKKQFKKETKKLEVLLATPKVPRTEIYKATKRALKARGKIFYSSEKEPYFFDEKKKRLYHILEGDFALWFSTELKFDRSQGVFKAVIKYLEGYAFKYGKKVEFKKFAFFDHDSYKLYINRFDGKMYILDGEEIKYVDLGTDGVFFRDHENCEPFNRSKSSERLSEKLLFHKSNFSDQRSALSPFDQEFILKWWFYSSFFRSLMNTKPIMVIYGPPNSYKTETARALLLFLFGSEANVNSPPSSVRDLRVVGDYSHIIFLDDFDDGSKNLESELVRMATSAKVDERKLYSNKGISKLSMDAFIGLTTKKPHFTREDFIQRVVLIRLESMGDNIASSTLKNQILANRNFMWREVLMDLNEIVKRIKKRRNKKPRKIEFRHADWAQFLLKATPTKSHGYIEKLVAKLNQDQINFLLEANPLAQALTLWLKKKKNMGRWIESGNLRYELIELAKHNQLDVSVYQNNQGYGVELKNVVSTFGRLYQTKSERRRGRNRYLFEKKSHSKAI